MQEMHENPSLSSAESESALPLVDEAEQSPPPPPVKRASCGMVCALAVLALLVALASMAALVYMWQKNHNVQMHLQQELQQLARLQTQANNNLSAQHELLTTAQQSIEKLENQPEAKPNSWLLAEADYLVKLAALNLNIDRNVALARELLATADRQLAMTNNATYWPARQALGNDMTALNALPTMDLPGIIVRLNTVKTWVEKLPQITPPVTTTNPSKTPVTTPLAAVTWQNTAQRLLNNIWQAFKQLIVIRYESTSQPEAPLLPPNALAYVTTNIQTQLTMAQWAALHHQQVIYWQAIDSAKTWISRYYAKNDAAVKAVLAILANLATINVNPNVPDLAQSLQALQALLNQEQEAN